VRKLAAEYSVDLSQVKGSGKNNRVLKEDILNHMKSPSPEVSGASDSSSVIARPSGKVLSTPAVRHLAKEKGVDLQDVRGTGEEGRVLREDFLRHIAQAQQAEGGCGGFG